MQHPFHAFYFTLAATQSPYCHTYADATVKVVVRNEHRLKVSKFVGRMFVLALMYLATVVHAGDWFPVPALMDGKEGLYKPLDAATKAWRICVLLPTPTDKYWWGVSNGVIEEGKFLGVTVGVYDAGGYGFLDKQKAQFDECLVAKADAIIVGAISADAFQAELDRANKLGVPVIDLINRLNASGIANHSTVSFADMGERAAQFVVDDASGKAVRLVIFPGPDGAGRVKAAMSGIWKKLAGTKIALVGGGFGATDISGQSTLVRKALDQQVQYVISKAVAAAFAEKYLKASPQLSHIKVLSFYATDDVLQEMRQSNILATPSDQPVTQARISVDLAVRALEKKLLSNKVSPKVLLFSKDNVSNVDLSTTLAPEGIRFVSQPLPN
jgi:protein TorT